MSRAGDSIHAMYIAGSLLPAHLTKDGNQPTRLADRAGIFETETTAFADVVFPAASFAEIDGTFTNKTVFLCNDPPNRSSPCTSQSRDWLIVSQLSKELGFDFGFEMSASAVFRELAERNSRYRDLAIPFEDESPRPGKARHCATADLVTILKGFVAQ